MKPPYKNLLEKQIDIYGLPVRGLEEVQFQHTAERWRNDEIRGKRGVWYFGGDVDFIKD